MTLQTNEIWANGITPIVPSDGKIAAGFACGDADPDLFNYVLKLYGECIQNLSAAPAGVSDGNFNVLKGRVDGHDGDVTTLAGRITTLENADLIDASETVKGALEVASTTEAIDNTDNVHALTPARQSTRDIQLGSLQRLMQVVPDGGVDNAWQTLWVRDAPNLRQATYNANSLQDCKGFYCVELDLAGDRYAVPLVVYWSNFASVLPKEVVVEAVSVLRDYLVVLNVNINTTLVTFSVYDRNGAVDPTYGLEAIRRLSMTDVIA